MGSVRERAISLLDTEEMTAKTIAKKIIEVVALFELDPNLCVGFGFDGASVMAGCKPSCGAPFKMQSTGIVALVD